MSYGSIFETKMPPNTTLFCYPRDGWKRAAVLVKQTIPVIEICSSNEQFCFYSVQFSLLVVVSISIDMNVLLWKEQTVHVVH